MEERLRREFGTRRVYVNAPSARERDECIREEFDGTNHREICKRYGISRATLYRIVGPSG